MGFETTATAARRDGRKGARISRRIRLGAVTLLLFAAAAPAQSREPILAQAQGPALRPAAPGQIPQPSAAPKEQAPAQGSAQAPSRSDAELVVTLLRTTLVALHQANLTGNYTVLRDLGAPGFRDKNSAADLAQIFAPIRQQAIDLAAVVLLDPQLSRVAITDQKMLHVVGALATKPVPVSFELLFQPVNNVWQIFGISVVPQANPAAGAAAPSASSSAAESQAKAKPGQPAKPAAAKDTKRTTAETKPGQPASGSR